MRQPVPLNRDDQTQPYPGVPRSNLRRSLARRNLIQQRSGATGSFSGSSATRAILAVIAALVLALLVYLITLSSQPSISGLLPSPNSTSPPGPAKIRATVSSSSKPIQRVILTIDGNVVEPAVQVRNDHTWVVNYTASLPKGQHNVQVQVIDTVGHAEQHTWSFMTAGPSVAPTVAFTGPPAGASLAPGPIRIEAYAVATSNLASAQILVNGHPVITNQAPATAASAGAPASGADSHPWSIFTDTTLAAGSYTVDVNIRDTDGQTSTSELRFSVAANANKATARFFTDAQLYVGDPFYSFWNQHDGAKLLGDPISPQFVASNGTTVQYFTNARLELLGGGKVGLGLLGKEALPSPQPKAKNPNNPSVSYYSETGHTLAGKFRDFWQQNGGVAIFGYPISEVLDENGLQVQYFERARLELRAGSNGSALTVQITPLGQQIWQQTQSAAQ